MYEITLGGTEFMITVRAERLPQFETESEHESYTGQPQRPELKLQRQLKLQRTRDLFRSNLMIYQTL